METANIWGQGQIFAFSAADGKSLMSEDFVGILCGDRIGIRFFTKIKRELAIVGIKAAQLSFKAVCGDYICAETDKGEIRIIYYDTHLIIGDLCGEASAVVFAEGRVKNDYIGNIQVHDSCDGDFTALACDGKKFAFAYGKSGKEAAEKAGNGLRADIDAEQSKKLEFYEKNRIENQYEKLYCKCISIMKTQLYSPEGCFNRIWSTPDRLPHKNMWLWDSVFHAMGYRNVNGEIAEDLILSLFANQYENGMIPHAANVNFKSEITQPPVIAWGAWNVYKKTGNKAFLKEVFNENKRFLDWCRNNRKPCEDELYVWHTSEDVLCRCDESGMDNSPRFDNVKNLQAIDFSCFMANEMRYMSKIAEEIGEDKRCFDSYYEKIKQAVNNKLWDEESGFYYDYDIDRNKMHKIKSVASFLPLFSGISNEQRAKSLVSWLKNPDGFYMEFPIPSISADDVTFGSDMWRGPVWINYNYMIIDGLMEYGYTELADEIFYKTLNCVNEWYGKTGTIFEFYDSENKRAPYTLRRKGEAVEPYDFEIRPQAIRDYGWSCALVCDMIASRYKNK